MEVNKYKLKFKLLFDKFFEENFELNSYYSENLLKYLQDRPDKSAEKILDSPFFSDLIMYSVTNLENATSSVKIFIMEVITIVVKNELQFSKLCGLQGFIIMADKICQLYNSIPPTPLHISAIKLAEAQTSHYSGIMWLVEHKVWIYILIPTIHHKAKKVAQAAYNFMSKLVWKLDEFDEEVAIIEVLQFIVDPIKNSEYNNIHVLDADGEKDIYDPILSHLHALLAIVCDADYSNVGANKVIPLLTKYFIIEPPLHLILEVTRDFDIACLLCQMFFRFGFGVYRDAVAKNLRPATDIPNEMITNYYNIVLFLLQKRMTSTAIDFVVKCVVFWAKVDNNVIPSTFERNGRIFDVQNQFVMLVVAPLLTYAYYVHHELKNRAMIEAMDVYALKLSKITTEHIVKAGYAFRTVIETSDAKKVAIKALRELFKLKGYLNVAQAGMLYQVLYYNLQIHVISDGNGGLIVNENPLKSPDDVKLLSLVLEVIKMLLKEHDINWYENVEIICLQTILMDLLKQNFMPTKQLLQAVDLIDLSVQKFLSPDMALLMESKRGSTLNEIINIMKLYIQHEEWEVRDSALHLLLSCTEVAFVKYMPLQKLLLENNLLVMAAQATLSDPQYYVQTTALRCLAAATKIESIWKEVTMVYPNLYIKLICMLKNNSEGIVRKEAANVLTEVYVNQKLPKNFIKCLYTVMFTAALNDLHWEVQIVALNFWKNVIRYHMSNRGMIDGKFPSVTFSKEKRKIVTLNDKEILKQLAGIMNDLSSVGCLNVLYECLNDEYNIEVIEQAHTVTKELIAVLDKYKYEIVPDDTIVTETDNIDMNIEDLLQDITTNTDEAMDLSYARQRNFVQLREEIIEGIVNTSHEDLLNEIYENSVNIKREEIEDHSLVAPINVNLINPNRFLRNFKESDYLTLIDNKKKWNSGPSNLDTLLDEILLLGEHKRDIGDDCND